MAIDTDPFDRCISEAPPNPGPPDDWDREPDYGGMEDYGRPGVDDEFGLVDEAFVSRLKPTTSATSGYEAEHPEDEMEEP